MDLSSNWSEEKHLDAEPEPQMKVWGHVRENVLQSEWITVTSRFMHGRSQLVCGGSIRWLLEQRALIFRILLLGECPHLSTPLHRQWSILWALQMFALWVLVFVWILFTFYAPTCN